MRLKSNFSFLEGGSHPEELVEEAHRVGIPSLAITDRAYIMYEGRILISGTREELLASKEARKIYLGEKFTM